MSNEMSSGSTALLYLSTFFVCAILYSLSVRQWDKIDKEGRIVKRGGKTAIFLSLMSLMIVCLLAGVRGDSVGADTSGYGVIAFRYAQGKTFTRYLLGRTEYSFYGLAYLVSKVTSNEGIWLGLIEVLTIIPIFYIIYKERNNIPPVLAIIVFLFKFYNYSICIMRQSMACSFVLLTIYFFQNRRYLLFLIWGIVAIGFHSTAFIGLGVYIVIYYMLRIGKGRRYKVLLSLSVLLGITIAFLPRIASTLLSSGLFPSYFDKFLDFFGEGSISRYGLFESICRILLFFPFIYILRKNKSLDFFSKYMITVSAVSCLMYVICNITWGINTVYRFTQYFDYSFIFSIALIPSNLRIKIGNTKNNKIWKGLFVVLFLIIYWLLVYIIMPDGLGFKTEHFSFR